jgi:ABC-type glycerol-3-phosphate transport system permease component
MRPSAKGYALKSLNILILLAFAVICAYPFYFVAINALSSASAINKGVYLVPKDFTTLYFQKVLAVPNVMNAALISLARTAVGTLFTVFCSTLLGYLVTKKTLPFRKAIYRFVILTMYMNAGLIPWYIIMMSLGLKNSFLLYVLPSSIVAFYVVLIKTYIESIPPALEESAEIDGAGVFTVFFRIIIPLGIPIIACVTVFCAVNQWNAWTDNFYLASDKRLTTLQYLLYGLLQSNMADLMNASQSGGLSQSTAKVTPEGLRYAMTVVTALPIVVAYPLMQRFFVKGIMLGAVKG